jgi:hypothetical protein
LQLGRPPEQSHFALALQHCHMAAGSLPHAQTFVPLPQSFGSAALAARAGCMAAAATTNSDANTNFFIRPSNFRTALSVMIYDNRIRPGNIAPEVANERGIVIQFKFGPH